MDSVNLTDFYPFIYDENLKNILQITDKMLPSQREKKSNK